MNTFRSCLVLCLLVPLPAATAFGQDNDAYAAIPSWVKIDRGALEESTALKNSTDHRLIAEIQEDIRQPVREPAYFHQQSAGRFSSLYARNMTQPPANPAAPRESDKPPELDGKPSLTTGNGWRVTMPNIRRNAAKLLLQRKF
jgi:hypothetical protein